MLETDFKRKMFGWSWPSVQKIFYPGVAESLASGNSNRGALHMETNKKIKGNDSKEKRMKQIPPRPLDSSSYQKQLGLRGSPRYKDSEWDVSLC